MELLQHTHVSISLGWVEWSCCNIPMPVSHLGGCVGVGVGDFPNDICVCVCVSVVVLR